MPAADMKAVSAVTASQIGYLLNNLTGMSFRVRLHYHDRLTQGWTSLTFPSCFCLAAAASGLLVAKCFSTWLFWSDLVSYAKL